MKLDFHSLLRKSFYRLGIITNQQEIISIGVNLLDKYRDFEIVGIFFD